jgi:hypothetical protein
VRIVMHKGGSNAALCCVGEIGCGRFEILRGR